MLSVCLKVVLLSVCRAKGFAFVDAVDFQLELLFCLYADEPEAKVLIRLVFLGEPTQTLPREGWSVARGGVSNPTSHHMRFSVDSVDSV